VKTITRFLALSALFLSVLPALNAATSSSLESARRAQALLGADVWSQVIRVENDMKSKRYPRVTHALVFELADILWFYTDSEGTQSFSLHKGMLAEEKADFGPLLREIDAGFSRWTVVSDSSPVAVSTAPLHNGCFIESVVALRDRLLHGGEAVHPRLLSYYIPTRSGLNGHTVLAYETAGRVEIIDSAQEGKRFTFSTDIARDPLKLARALRGSEVSAARVLPVDWPTARPGYYSTTLNPAAAMASSG
jgi:hypothetical protein